MFRRIKTISDVVGRTFIQAMVLGFVLFVCEKVYSVDIGLDYWLAGATILSLWNSVLLTIHSVRGRA
jgi:hypothetical protein